LITYGIAQNLYTLFLIAFPLKPSPRGEGGLPQARRMRWEKSSHTLLLLFTALFIELIIFIMLRISLRQTMRVINYNFAFKVCCCKSSNYYTSSGFILFNHLPLKGKAFGAYFK